MIHNFLKALYDAKGKDQIDLVYDTIDDLLIALRFNDVDAILASVEIDRVNNAVLLSLLTVTLTASDQLRSRYSLYQDILAHFIKNHGKDEANKMLSGLD